MFGPWARAAKTKEDTSSHAKAKSWIAVLEYKTQALSRVWRQKLYDCEIRVDVWGMIFLATKESLTQFDSRINTKGIKIQDCKTADKPTAKYVY